MSSNPKVLIVDDEPRMCESVKTLIKNNGHEIFTANSGKEAIEYLNKGNFDLVLLDIAMPDVDGYEVMDHINRQSSDTQVIIMTGHASIESAVEMLRRQAYDYLRKPFEPEELLSTVKKALGYRRLKRDRDQTVEELNKLSALRQILLDSLPHVAMLLRPQTREIVAANRAGEDVGAVPGKKCYETWGQSESPCPWCLAPVLWETGEAQHSETYGVGSWWDLYWTPVSDDLYFHYAYDITERKKVDEALREREEFSSNLLKNSPIPIVVVNKDTSIRYVNSKLEELTGYTSEEILGKKSPYPWWTANQTPRNLSIQQKSELKGVSRLERLHRKKNGEDFWIELTATPLIGKGEDKYTLTTWVDITERKRAEEAIRESEEKYRAIFEQAGDSIVLVDAETGAPVEFNEMAYKTLGYTRDEFKKLKISDIDVDRSHDELLENLKRRVHEGIFKLDSRHKTKDGRIRNVQITGKSINIHGKNVNLVIWNDITERKEAEELIKASLREKEVLLKEVHHRVKNNLQIISSLLNMSRRRAGNQEAMDLIAEAEAKIQTMALIHTQLYQSDRFDQIDMQKHIEDIFIYISQLYGAKKNITPIINTSDVILSVTQAIPFALAMNELIANVFKHAFEEGKGGILEVYMEQSSDDTISVKVKDDGIGIPEEVDIDNTDTLGMKLVRNLVLRQLKGKLRIERNNGTEVFMEFKVSKEEVNHA